MSLIMIRLNYKKIDIYNIKHIIIIYNMEYFNPFNNSIINQLYNKASESKITNQLAASIIKSNKIVDKPYCNLLCNVGKENNIASLHAEAHAISKYFGKSFYYNKKNKKVYLDEKKKRNIDLIVIRINKLGYSCNARPCYNCLNMMKAVGINKVYYSINLNNVNNVNKDDINFFPIKLVCEKVKDMISIQVSAINRCLELNYSKSNNSQSNEYYDNLLKKIFPPVINFNNLNYFIQFNLISILPKYKVKIINIKNDKIVHIINNNNIIIIKANIIN